MCINGIRVFGFLMYVLNLKMPFALRSNDVYSDILVNRLETLLCLAIECEHVQFL